MPTTSIITINYNNVIGLEKTIQSVVSQTYSKIEYIIIDGGSTDGSVEVIQKHSNKISYWVSEKDNGIYHAMNKGIKQATSDYLLFLNSGDALVDKETLSIVLPLLENYDIVGGDIIGINEKREHFYIKNLEKINDPIVLIASGMHHQSSFIKRTLFQKIGLYDESVKITSDYQFFILAFVKYESTYKYIHQAISYYELSGRSADPKNLLAIREEQRIFIQNLFLQNKKIDYYALFTKYKFFKQLCEGLARSKIIYFLYKLGYVKWYSVLKKYLDE